MPYSARASIENIPGEITEINEGSPLVVLFDATGLGLATGTKHYWKIINSPGITTDDFISGKESSEVRLRSNNTFPVLFRITEDQLTEGDEWLRIGLYTNSDFRASSLVATSEVLIRDTSRGELKSYTAAPSSNTADEGNTVSTTVTTTGLAAGTELYWSLSGTNIDSSDFLSGSLNGSGKTKADGSFVFSHTLANDNKTEGLETAVIKLFSDEDRTKQVGSSAFIDINDTSTNPPPPPPPPEKTYTIQPSSSSTDEGNTVSTTVTTTGLAAGTELYWSLSGTNIDSLDFLSGSLKGSGKTKADGSFVFSHTLANDNKTEGLETAVIKLFSDEDRTKQVGSSAFIDINDTSTNPPPPPPPPEKTYTIQPSSSSTDEGNTVSTTVTTTGLAAGTELYWSLSGTNIDSSDFLSGSLKGSGKTKADGSFVFSHTLANDNKTEGLETAVIKLFSDEDRTKQVGSSAFIDINDTSTNPPPPPPPPEKTYTIQPSSSSTDEGNTVSTTVTTTGLAAGTELYWSLSGTNIDSLDFLSGSLKGSGKTKADGSFVFSHTLANDNKTEGLETAVIKLFSDEDRTKQVGSSAFIDINDTSTNPPPPPPPPEKTYTIQPSSSSTDEGNTVSTTVTTTGLAAGTELYWSLSGTNIDSSDFLSGSLNGSGKTKADGSFVFSHTLANDNKTEGLETAVIKLFSDEDRTKQVGSSAFIDINDTSTNPPPPPPPPEKTYTIQPSSSSTDEGNTVSTTVTTTGLAAGTELYWSLSGTNIDSSDFLSGSLNGSGKTKADGSFVFSHTLANDNKTEGLETAVIKLFSDAQRSTQVGASALIGINDRSISPVVLSAESYTVQEGGTVIANLATSGLTAGRDIFWRYSGNGITVDDFVKSPLSGSLKTNSSKLLSIKSAVTLDGITEGIETLTLTLFWDKDFKNQLGNSIEVKIVDSRGATQYRDASYTLLPNQLDLTLVGSYNIDGIGNERDNIINGNIGNNRLLGWRGSDTLTGGQGQDTFEYTGAIDSRLGSIDRITDFSIGIDRIKGPHPIAKGNVINFGEIAEISEFTIASKLTRQTFGAKSAAFVSSWGNQYLILNDTKAGFSSQTDTIVNITGYSGSLSNMQIF